MLRDAYAIVKSPRITEKATAVTEAGNAYTFEVALDANKVEKVRTVIMKGKPKKVRMNWGMTADWKKAIVTLAEGQRIDVM